MKLHACVGAALAIVLVGCISSSPGVVHTSADNPIVTIGAGEMNVGGGGAFPAYYVIDRRTQICWFMAWQAGGPMDCCKLRSVPEAASIVAPWTTDAMCASSPPLAPSGPSKNIQVQ